MKQTEVSEQIITIAKTLHEKNYLAAADGNISYRLDEKRILITPSGVSKASLSPEEMALVTIDGEILEGKPSSELKMHLAVYRSSEKAKAVIHAHPPVSVAWTVAEPDLKELPAACLSELILACGSIPIVPFALPGTEEMGTNLASFLPKQRAFILARHGVLTWGESLEEAMRGVERIEHTALVLYHAKTLGALTELPKESIEKLKFMREKIGEKIL